MRFFRRFPLLALLAACLFFCACAAPVKESGAPGADAGAAQGEAAAQPSPTPRSGNPVWLFYQDFYSAAQESLDGLHAALAQSNAPEALEGELLLSALEERLTEGMVSFGLLMRADDASGQSYASSVEGASTGSGVITSKDGQSELSFTYADGVTLTGSLTPYRLRYTRQAPEQAPAYALLLLRAPKGWAAVLDLGGGPAYVLRYGANELGLYAIGYATPAEGGAPAAPLLTYDICIRGAVQSWVYGEGGLSIAELE